MCDAPSKLLLVVARIDRQTVTDRPTFQNFASRFTHSHVVRPTSRVKLRKRMFSPRPTAAFADCRWRETAVHGLGENESYHAHAVYRIPRDQENVSRPGKTNHGLL
jgi:hypothetical protein